MHHARARSPRRVLCRANCVTEEDEEIIQHQQARLGLQKFLFFREEEKQWVASCVHLKAEILFLFLFFFLFFFFFSVCVCIWVFVFVFVFFSLLLASASDFL